MSLQLLIADDHEIVRRGLRAILETQQDWTVVAEAVTGRQAIDQAREHPPDIAILDIGMPELNGLEATRQILKLLPQTEVLILTMHESEQIVREVLAAGARGYVLKSDAGRDLVAAVEALRDHRTFFSSKISDMLLTSYLRQPERNEPVEPTGRSRLTAREREIVQLLAEGKSNKEVAQMLNISIKTAETHRTNIMNKLDLRSITELVRYAVRNNIVEP
ncbi:MAG TPA: response regulator transcription factor [Bryobacteraceae bacterium]|nr:response regulator transcription factor [Bryobacteraceae bacterium]